MIATTGLSTRILFGPLDFPTVPYIELGQAREVAGQFGLAMEPRDIGTSAT